MRLLPLLINKLGPFAEEKYVDGFGKKLEEKINNLIFSAKRLNKDCAEFISLQEVRFGEEKIDAYLGDTLVFIQIVEELATVHDDSLLEVLRAIREWKNPEIVGE
jgi:hypothetical protein